MDHDIQPSIPIVSVERRGKIRRFPMFRFPRLTRLTLNKRQRFVISVLILSTCLFLVEHIFGKSGILFSFGLAACTVVFLLWSNYRDIRENFTPTLFILPFFYTLSFALFYFLAPGRLLTRVIMTPLYAIGLYSLFLSQNIFIVASIRTIALLSGARIVSFVVTLVSFFFLATVIFSLPDISVFSAVGVIPIAGALFLCSFFLILQSLWTITLERSVRPYLPWAFFLALCLVEVGIVLWFWPSTPTLIAIFLAGFFYTIVGLSQVWLERRLFRGVLWEYIWVGILVLSILLLFTPWRGK